MVEFHPDIRKFIRKKIVHGVRACVDAHYDIDTEILLIYNLYRPDLPTLLIEPSLVQCMWTKLYVFVPKSQYHSLDLTDCRSTNNYSIDTYTSSSRVSFPVSHTNPLHLYNDRALILYGSYLQQRCLELNPRLKTVTNVMECTMDLWRHVCPLIPSFGMVPREYDFESKKRIPKDHDELLISLKTRLFVIVDISDTKKTIAKSICNNTQTILHTSKSICIELNVYLQIISITDCE